MQYNNLIDTPVAGLFSNNAKINFTLITINKITINPNPKNNKNDRIIREKKKESKTLEISPWLESLPLN